MILVHKYGISFYVFLGTCLVRWHIVIVL